MSYLTHFDLSVEPFSNAHLSQFYFASQQHTDALKRLRHAASTRKGLAILVGEIGLGKTTLARRMLESFSPEEFEAALLVIVHGGITPNWLLKRIALQLNVPDPADEKLTLLSQLYQRLIEIDQQGKRAVVLIDEAQMLASRDLMEEFRGLLNLEVPERKLLSFIFFGLPETEDNLRLDPPLAQRVAMRIHLKPFGLEDTVSYIEYRLNLAGAEGRTFFSPGAVHEIFQLTQGTPRLINTLCDNLLLELFFAKQELAEAELVRSVAKQLGFGRGFDAHSNEAKSAPPPPKEIPATEGGPGHDAIQAVEIESVESLDDQVSENAKTAVEQTESSSTHVSRMGAHVADAIAAQVFQETDEQTSASATEMQDNPIPELEQGDDLLPAHVDESSGHEAEVSVQPKMDTSPLPEFEDSNAIAENAAPNGHLEPDMDSETIHPTDTNEVEQADAFDFEIEDMDAELSESDDATKAKHGLDSAILNWGTEQIDAAEEEAMVDTENGDLDVEVEEKAEDANQITENSDLFATEAESPDELEALDDFGGAAKPDMSQDSTKGALEDVSGDGSEINVETWIESPPQDAPAPEKPMTTLSNLQTVTPKQTKRAEPKQNTTSSASQKSRIDLSEIDALLDDIGDLLKK